MILFLKQKSQNLVRKAKDFDVSTCIQVGLLYDRSSERRQCK